MSDADAYIYGICAERRKPGGCQLHNLHCGYPDCDRVLPNHGARDPIATAREEGRREGLEEAEAAVRSLPYSSKTISGMNSALAAIRALKEKQPTE